MGKWDDTYIGVTTDTMPSIRFVHQILTHARIALYTIAELFNIYCERKAAWNFIGVM